MKQYLVQVGYTPEAWAAMIDQPQNRFEKVAPALESLGGRFLHSWLCFGEYDLVGIIELPDDVEAAAFSIGVTSKGSVRSLTTTPLLTMEAGMEAMRMAQRMAYAPPSRSAAGVR